jgi:hypothetical protein
MRCRSRVEAPSLPLLTKPLVRRAKTRVSCGGKAGGKTEPPSVVGTPILFWPDNVRNVLGRLPSVAALLPDPAVEGEPSDAFPGVLRKTEREVYRWIANTHYDHLADAVLHLERVHAAGCTFGSLLSTRDREQFVSLTAEVFVAVELDDIAEAPDAGPLRRGTIGYPGFSGYSAAGVFRRTVERSQRKAKRRQAQGVPASARVLIVYLMGTQVAEDLSHPAHLGQAE